MRKKCEICGFTGKFTIHLMEEHNLLLKDYIIQYELSGITPKCQCGYCEYDMYCDFEKVALYVDNDNNVTHAAKQYKNRWRSKLGASVVIEHELDWISGFDYDNYGKVGIILKRKR